MTVITPTDSPKSVRNRSVIEVFGGVSVLSLAVYFSDGMGTCVIGLDQISSFFSFQLCLSIIADTIKRGIPATRILFEIITTVPTGNITPQSD